MNLGVGEPDIGFRPLRVRRLLLVLVRLQLAAPDRDLLGVGTRERDGRALRVHLLRQRGDRALAASYAVRA